MQGVTKKEWDALAEWARHECRKQGACMDRPNECADEECTVHWEDEEEEEDWRDSWEGWDEVEVEVLQGEAVVKLNRTGPRRGRGRGGRRPTFMQVFAPAFGLFVALLILFA